MAMDAHVGAFNTGTGTSDVVVTDPGFTPKAIIFWWSGRTESTDTVGRADAYPGIGIATGTTSRRCTSSFAEDAQVGSDTDRVQQDDACIAALTKVRTVDGLGDLKSFDANGFTIAIDDAFSRDIRVHYLALGGDITNATTGQFQVPGATGNQDVEGLGFQPEFVLFFSNGHTATPPALTGNLGLFIGAAVSASAEATCGAREQTDEASTETGKYIYSTECISLLDTGTNLILDRAEFVNFLADGFKINWLERQNTRWIHYLALAGGDYTVGTLQTQTDTVTDITESGFGFKPSASLFFSALGAESTQDTQDTPAELSIGGFSATDERGAQGFHSKEALATTDVATILETDAVYAHINSSAGVEGLMDIKSIDADGFTCIMDDADPSASFVWYAAFGPRAADADSAILANRRPNPLLRM